MTWLDAIILGLIEGITEFLPVSSTGHLLLVAGLLGLNEKASTRDAVEAFTIVVQGCSLLAILGLYWPRLKQMTLGLLGRDPFGRKLLLFLIIGFLPMGILAPLLYDTIKDMLFRPIPVLIALAFGGAWMIWIDRWRARRAGEANEITIEQMTWKHALGIGLFQAVSMWPGTSRAMMTIAGGVMLRLKPTHAAEFSFLLGLPTIAGATVYELYNNLFNGEDGAQNMFQELGWSNVLIGFLVTVISAALAVKWLIAFLDRHGLAAFGWYRIVMAIVLGAMLLSGVVTL